MLTFSRRQIMHRGALIGASAVVTHTALTTVARAQSTTDEHTDALTTVLDENGIVRLDVAENATDFAWAGEPALQNGMPASRTAFASQGYLYPTGILTGSNGVLDDGSPEFVEQVLGLWSCWGWYLGADAPDGRARWLTSHLVSFGDGAGASTLVSEGYSIDDVDMVLERAIVGGTGRFTAARGMQLETNLGFNASGGINIRYEYRLADPLPSVSGRP